MIKLFRITTVPISIEKLLGNQLTEMNQHFEVTAISSDEVQLAKAAAQLGVKHHAINMSRQITPIKDIKALWQMYRYFKTEKPQIVHTHTPKAGIIGMLAAKLAGVPIRLHTVAGLPLMEATGTKRKVLDRVEMLTYHCATKVYPNSKGLYDFILKEKLTKPTKLKVIGNGSTNGINTTYFSRDQIADKEVLALKASYGISSDQFVFIFVGRLVADKGINELVKAFSTLNDKKAILLLVGNLEPDLDPLNPETLAEIHNNPNIIAAGYQTDVRPFFAIANALVFPSYREGFPNVVLQAGAMGLPSIVSDINGCNEIIQQDVNGLIIPPKNTESLRDAMSVLLQDREKYGFLTFNARLLVESKYRQAYIWGSILKEYRHLLNSL